MEIIDIWMRDYRQYLGCILCWESMENTLEITYACPDAKKNSMVMSIGVKIDSKNLYHLGGANCTFVSQSVRMLLSNFPTKYKASAQLELW